jgi:hypothetical protein
MRQNFSSEVLYTHKKETAGNGLFFVYLIQNKNIQDFQLRMMP